MTVVTAAIITTIVYTLDVRIPANKPTCATTMRPTSPLEIIPTPTLRDVPLSFKNITAGSPVPAYSLLK